MAKEKGMTTVEALALIKAAAPAIQYMDRLTQQTVNGNFDLVAQDRAEGEDVDAKEISKSWKVRTNTSKLGKMWVKLAEVAEGHIAFEAKLKAIPAETVKADKVLNHA